MSFYTGLQKVSLIDYPGKISAVIFLYGCNFRCGFCHNPELVIEKPSELFYSKEEVVAFVKKRIGKLDGIVICGGEPLLNESVFELTKEIKEMGYKVKLDTNGSLPDRLLKLIEKKQIDYIAMDIKGPLEDYSKIAGVNVNTKNIERSIDIIMKSGLEYEFRTTLLRIFHDSQKILKIGKLIKGAENYYLQNFRPGNIINMELNNQKAFDDNEMLSFKKILEPYIKTVGIR